ncbi:GNAT family N-acetyltransferase [Synechococcus sp. BIOS-U3-1]|uniref:GNAT family N-acetyltransferase n=1 Tax=Synechococcus sp. BIOS-U3-1 TaxID=1400865 RepID=UPI001644BBB2
MLKIVKAEICDLTNSNLESIYNWRFKEYRCFFATEYVPSFQDHKEFISKEIKENSVSWFFGYFQEKIVSCCCIEKRSHKINSDRFTMILTRVMVNPRWKRKGFARQTISHGIECVRRNREKYRVVLEVFNTNSNAIKLYEKMGFVDTQSKGRMRTMELRHD